MIGYNEEDYNRTIHELFEEKRNQERNANMNYELEKLSVE